SAVPPGRGALHTCASSDTIHPTWGTGAGGTPMRPTLMLATCCCIVLTIPLDLRSQDKPISTGPAEDAQVARVQKLLDEIQLETKGFFPEKTPLVKFLAALEAAMQKEHKISLRIDNAAFGADLSRITGAEIRLIYSRKAEKMSLRSAL